LDGKFLRKEVTEMQHDCNASIPEAAPLVYQLRELILSGPERSEYLHMTQSSCGGEDVIEYD